MYISNTNNFFINHVLNVNAFKITFSINHINVLNLLIDSIILFLELHSPLLSSVVINSTKNVKDKYCRFF